MAAVLEGVLKWAADYSWLSLDGNSLGEQLLAVLPSTEMTGEDSGFQTFGRVRITIERLEDMADKEA